MTEDSADTLNRHTIVQSQDSKAMSGAVHGEELRRPLALSIFSSDLLFCCYHANNCLEINQLRVVTTRCRVTTNGYFFHFLLFF